MKNKCTRSKDKNIKRKDKQELWNIEER